MSSALRRRIERFDSSLGTVLLAISHGYNCGFQKQPRRPPRPSCLLSNSESEAKVPELTNPKHEKFAQNMARGLSPTEAYISAGYKGKGAANSGARLLKHAQVCTRLDELRKAVTASVLQLAITERNERLIALQEGWDALREAKAALPREDYTAAMKTGVVSRRLRWIGGKDGREIVEYEINTALIESLNSVEKRAAIETGQEQENVNLTGQISAKSIALSKVMSLEELEALEKKMVAAMEAEKNPGKVIEPPKP